MGWGVQSWVSKEPKVICLAATGYKIFCKIIIDPDV